ncbi:hypothetical protein Pcinc_038081 [Petrolisthes cinctipes]|uniref:Uncharacterized protein n=1 Tax=Petrolisthes cinctipes TaxID=88211 RepID=A0AAE1EKR0_PETCI|nr:hypothetical protein Pcinc_038081 [Petrolisthes cinctipes]
MLTVLVFLSLHRYDHRWLDAQDKAQRDTQDKAQRDTQDKAQRDTQDKAQRDTQDNAQRDTQDKAQRDTPGHLQQRGTQPTEQNFQLFCLMRHNLHFFVSPPRRHKAGAEEGETETCIVLVYILSHRLLPPLPSLLLDTHLSYSSFSAAGGEIKTCIKKIETGQKYDKKVKPLGNPFFVFLVNEYLAWSRRVATRASRCADEEEVKVGGDGGLPSSCVECCPSISAANQEMNPQRRSGVSAIQLTCMTLTPLLF